MLDARRMEVYTAVFNSGKMIFETTALILDEQAFSNLLSTQQIVFWEMAHINFNHSAITPMQFLIHPLSQVPRV